MKSYVVELVRQSYATIWVEAESEEAAKDLVWQEVERGGATYLRDSHWDIESVEEFEDNTGGAA
jgi:hypothetical protein